ncbi:PHA/PHB synthase family protein [Rhodovulum sp. DZ06]|uniref:PHA/PHB synthase family protein n=1 Tax=Rhodovulum sp. DZ06 TaxID=3425126 RepID=UPI003D350218
MTRSAETRRPKRAPAKTAAEKAAEKAAAQTGAKTGAKAEAKTADRTGAARAAPAPHRAPGAAPCPAAPTGPGHRHQGLDRSVRAAAARMTGGVSPHAPIQAWTDWALALAQAPGRQMELAERARENALKLTMHAMQGADAPAPFAPKPFDHRFHHQGWDQFPFSLWRQSFLAAQDWWDAATDRLRGLDPAEADRTRFMARQALDTLSPSNFPALNPEILEAIRASGGRNLAEGAANFAHDALHALSQRRDPPAEGVRVGEDLAITPGKVVFRNDLMELIQYSPQTETVHAEPILVVPAWIMKYYILDLRPDNSMVGHLVRQGFTVFMISWRNPTADQADLSLEDYRLRGIGAAMNAIGKIIPDQKVHAAGYCLGGTMLAIAAAAMARDGDDRLASITLMAAQVDFAEAGELLLFLDESQIAWLEDMMWEQGYLDRPQMARAFSAIRAEDLIWSRGVRRYFLGMQELPDDMGAWSQDTTRMPARMHSEYLRGLFLENRLSAGRFSVEGCTIALKDIRAPMFVVATEADHIAPWRSVYKTRLFTDCDLTFALVSGGHNRGIVSEPGGHARHMRLSHRPAGGLYVDPDAWLATHAPEDGSWWTPWEAWLAARSSADVPARIPGDGPLPALCDAPGTYIHQQ